MSVHDHGIIGYVTKNAADETYTDADGTTQDSVAFTGTDWLQVGTIWLGNETARLALDVLVTRVALNAVSVRASIVREAVGGMTFTAAPLATSMTTANGSTTVTYEQSIGASDACVRLLADDVPLSGTLVVEVKDVGGSAAVGDSVVIAARTGW